MKKCISLILSALVLFSCRRENDDLYLARLSMDRFASHLTFTNLISAMEHYRSYECNTGRIPEEDTFNFFIIYVLIGDYEKAYDYVENLPGIDGLSIYRREIKIFELIKKGDSLALSNEFHLLADDIINRYESSGEMKWLAHLYNLYSVMGEGTSAEEEKPLLSSPEDYKIFGIDGSTKMKKRVSASKVREWASNRNDTLIVPLSFYTNLLESFDYADYRGKEDRAGICPVDMRMGNKVARDFKHCIPSWGEVEFENVVLPSQKQALSVVRYTDKKQYYYAYLPPMNIMHVRDSVLICYDTLSKACLYVPMLNSSDVNTALFKSGEKVAQQAWRNVYRQELKKFEALKMNPF